MRSSERRARSHERRIGMVLGLQWFRRPAVRGLRWRRVVAAACATWVAVIGATLCSANVDRLHRGQAQQPAPGYGHPTFRVLQTDAPYRGDVWTTIVMGGLRAGADPSAAAPPGVPSFVRPGTAYVSPAVARAMTADPLAAGRVPGRVVGTIGSRGLQSPDQYLVYAGVEPGKSWQQSSGWGSSGVDVPRAGMPRWSLLAIVGVLVGLPALLLIRATARMSSISRKRSLAACQLLGIPVRLLATAAATDASLCATAGVLAGVVAATGTVLATHATTLFGIEWFAPGTVVSLRLVGLVWLVIVGLVVVDAARSTRGDLRDPFVARAGGSRAVRWWTVVPLLLGLSGLAGVADAHSVLDIVLPTGRVLLYFFVCGAMTVLGALAGLPVVAEITSRCLRRRPTRSVAGFVAARRLSWRRDAIATSCVGLTVVAMGSLVGAGALADLSAMSAPDPQGVTYDVAGIGRPALAAALRVGTALRMLQVTRDDGRVVDVADCATLRRFVEVTAPSAGARFAARCTPGATIRIVSAGGGPGRVVLPDARAGLLGDAELVAEDPATAAIPAGEADIIARPGPVQHDVDSYLSRVLRVAPYAEVSEVSQDSNAPRVAPTRRMLVVCTILGMLTAVVLLAMSALERQRRDRVDDAFLIALGAGRRLTSSVHALTTSWGAAVCLAVGLLGGVLSATVYDDAGGLTSGPGVLGVRLAGVSVAISTLAVLATWVGARRHRRSDVVGDMRRE